MPANLCCPDCSMQTLVHVEDTEPDSSGEYKEVRTCTRCDALVYIVRTPTELHLEPPSDYPKKDKP